MDVLADVAPGLFPILVGQRKAALAREFGRQRLEWLAAMRWLRGQRYVDQLDEAVLDLLAWRFRDNHDARPSVSDLVSLRGITFPEARKVSSDEALHRLEVEFEDDWENLSDRVGDLLRGAAASVKDMACELVAGHLNHVRLSNQEMARVTGVALRTVERHRQMIEDDLARIFA
jgi:hypothetical protein